MRYATNIEHEGECPDCTRFEKQIDKLNADVDKALEARDAVVDELNKALADKEELIAHLKFLKSEIKQGISEGGEVCKYLCDGIESIIKKHE